VTCRSRFLLVVLVIEANVILIKNTFKHHSMLKNDQNKFYEREYPRQTLRC